jgi:hypothetical protein
MTTFYINVPKAKAKLECDFESLPPEMQLAVVQAGLEKIVNSGTTKATKADYPVETELQAVALELAGKKLDALKSGEFKPGKRTSATSGKVAGVVMTEARRLAKNIVKAGIKAQNKRISDYEAKAITEAANLYLEEHPELIEAAKASIEASNNLASTAAVDVNHIPVSAEKVKKNEEKKAKAKAETAAKNAGKPGPQASAIKKQAKPVPPRRPAPEQHVTH